MPEKVPLVFDLGGVLIDWNPRYLYRQIYTEAELEHFLATICTASWNLALDAGRPFAEAVAEKQAEFPAYREAIQWWHTRWVDMLGGPIQGTVDLLAELRDLGHPLYALTNWSAETFPTARERFPFLGWFREIVVSGEVGLAKPDPAIFRLALDRCGLAAQGTVYIDDSLANVDTAKQLGFDGVRFTGAEALRRELAERGLL